VAPDLHFDEASHTYRLGGVRLPSVTQVLDPLQELDGIPRHILEAAAAFGTNVHAACHLSNLGVLDEEQLDPALLPYLTAWRKFLDDVTGVVVGSEVRVVNRHLRYAGTLDSLVRIKGVHELVDIKATAAIPRTVGPQTAAYAHALGEPRIKRRVVQLRGDGTYRTERLTDPTDWNLFLSALNVSNWRNRNAA
jgi:hypothetical protein